MTAETLAQALEREHHEIDAGLETFATGNAGVAPLHQAISALRRHIYLEEAMLFPPLREKGFFAPVMVMIREHGEMWRLMDQLEAAPEPKATDDAYTQLLALIEAHNMKEEQILYPSADTALDAEAAARLSAFMASGSTPSGWVCQGA